MSIVKFTLAGLLVSTTLGICPMQVSMAAQMDRNQMSMNHELMAESGMENWGLGIVRTPDSGFRVPNNTNRNSNNRTNSSNIPCSQCYAKDDNYALKDAGALIHDRLAAHAAVPVNQGHNIPAVQYVTAQLNSEAPIANAPPLVGTVILLT